MENNAKTGYFITEFILVNSSAFDNCVGESLMLLQLMEDMKKQEET